MKPNVVVLTGAGISAESGLKTFRDNDGLWENHSIEDVATPEAFERDPNLVYRFYNERRAQLLTGNVEANLAHIALAKLEANLGDSFTLVTQNVDNLHEKGGSINVIHMHGELLSARCSFSGKSVHYTGVLDGNSRCTCCHPANIMRPDIVWFGEMPKYMDYIYERLSAADWFISIGTSGNVYPAAGFVEVAKSADAKTVELNLEPSINCHHFDKQYSGRATEIVPAFIHNTFLSE